MNIPFPLSDGEATRLIATEWIENNDGFSQTYTYDATEPMCLVPGTKGLYQNAHVGLSFGFNGPAIDPITDTVDTLQERNSYTAIGQVKVPGMEEPEIDWVVALQLPTSTIYDGQNGQVVRIVSYDGTKGEIKWCVDNARIYAIRGDSKTVLDFMPYIADVAQPENSFFQYQKSITGNLCFEAIIGDCNN